MLNIHEYRAAENLFKIDITLFGCVAIDFCENQPCMYFCSFNDSAYKR